MKTHPRIRCLLAFVLASSAFGLLPLHAASADGREIRSFLQNHCVACHEGEGAEAGLDLTALEGDLGEVSHFAKWVRVHDRVRDGEMPPEDAGDVNPDERRAFVQQTESWLRDHQRSEHERMGRVRGRRLTNRQLERTLHDVLGVDIPLATLMPEDPTSGGFTTVAEAQQMSHFQLARHVEVVDAALDEAFRRATSKSDEWSKDYSAKDLARTRKRCREPELIDGRIVVWSSRLIFYGRIPRTSAPDDGWYRFHIRGIQALKSPKEHGVWCTIRSGPCVSSAPLLAWIDSFEATDTPKDIVVEAWLPKRHMLEIRPGDRTLKQARFAGGQAETGEGGPQNVPGVAIESITMERIHRGPDNKSIRKRLFGDLELEIGRKGGVTVHSDAPLRDASRLLHNFAETAFRRPVDEETMEPYYALVTQSLQDGEGLYEALRIGYRAILCSPRFLYFHENPGPLDDYAVASRLSYLLWSRMPDERLLNLAEQGRLRDPEILCGEVDRMLAHPYGQQFVEDFAREWLELSEIDATEPDTRMHPDFDVIVQYAMLAETHAYLQQMLDENLSVRQLIDSDYTFLNSRLARYYEIEGVEGDALQKVALRPEHHRGGVLTQGSVLKVTANGTNTSPVLRGVWICERLLGVEVPPPPESVPAIEPDVRGASSIRELLEKHRSDTACASCHVDIDPPGFALENYDAAGGWREHYTVKDGRRTKRGPRIDPGYVMPDGRPFENIAEFRKLILTDPAPLARNVVEKLLTYGTGAEPSFADREVLQSIVAETADDHYGLRSLLYAAVTSSIFLEK